ncbi:MAG: ABC transporter ATP-binding protein [Natronomonas sp.]|jgi:ABC-2 type transport system ATP-binding protein|uniref:ABC transporter ATP-binding protein n=1 Tax=Natronomonas sp. TaxID=2184060 RepID=UPI00286FB85F|nr:ABC transporter ATP-binding protein [Natronomonas sp.]MDR9431417.1 ABC transporter ATP-binding protein [Natronomonas sp.]
MQSEPAIRADGLRKAYGDVQALDGLTFEVDRGEFFGLLGPNGAGKTTFINVLVGLVRKGGGAAEVFGFDVEADYRRARDRIGIAPQEFNVDRFFPIHEVLEHKAGYHGVPPAEAERRAEEALKTVGIWDKRETRFDWLSGGMKRRFLLARALVTDPELLILDEPTAGVDVQLRRDLWHVIERLNAEGTTILLTTHYIEEAERLCDRVAIVDSGRVVDVSTPDELRSRGTDQVHLTLADRPASVPELGVDGVVETRLDGSTLVVTAQGGGAVAPDLLRALEYEGHEVLDLDIQRASLEEVFVDMTRTEENAEPLGVIQ